MRTKYTKVKKMWADMGYQGRNLKNHIKEEYDIDIEIVKRPTCRFWVHKDTPPELLPTREQGFIAFLIIVRTGHRKAESTARRKDSNRGMFFLALFFIANQ